MSRVVSESFLLELPGDIPSKKNSMTFVGPFRLAKEASYAAWEGSMSFLANANFISKYGDKYNLPFTCELMTILRIWPKDRRKDTINALAGVADALEWHKTRNPNGIYKNDRQIVSAQIIMMEVDKENPRFTFEIGLVDGSDGQGKLF